MNKKSIINGIKRVMYYTGFSPLPLRINAAVTNRCNFFCPTCSKWRQKKGEEMTAREWWKGVFKKLKGKALTRRNIGI
jgi:MoaA/NifB/PqqE/SkfB family radical SAM enzyme